MPTVFESISDGFYTAVFEPDPEKRKDKIEAWIKESTPVIQSAVERDLRAYLEDILEATWTEKGWVSRVKKFYGLYNAPIRKQNTSSTSFIDEYKLYLDIKIRRHISRDKDLTADTLTPEVRAKTIKAAEAAKTAVARLEPSALIEKRDEKLRGGQISTEEDDDDYENSGRSPSDDRSDSMNPNNDAYQASMDNRSDQMNPNNDAYWSSRGR